MVTAITMNYAEEAIGVARAAEPPACRSSISFTVETDGRLPTGQTLRDAIEQVDAATSAYPAYYMINCAHPTHFDGALAAAEPWVAAHPRPPRQRVDEEPRRAERVDRARRRRPRRARRAVRRAPPAPPQPERDGRLLRDRPPPRRGDRRRLRPALPVSPAVTARIRPSPSLQATGMTATLPSWMRNALFATAAMNIFAGLGFLPPATGVRALAGMPPGEHPVYLATVALFVMTFGVGYFWVAAANRPERLFITLAAIGKLGFFRHRAGVLDRGLAAGDRGRRRVGRPRVRRHLRRRGCSADLALLLGGCAAHADAVGRRRALLREADRLADVRRTDAGRARSRSRPT